MSNISFPCCQSFGSSGNLGKNLNDTFEITNTGGYSSIGFKCFVPTGGGITFEASYDGINWEPINLRSVTEDIFVNTTYNGSDFIGSISAVRKFRFRTSLAGSSAGTVIGQLQRDASVLEGIEFGYPPHRFGFPPVHKDSSFTTSQTGTSLWSPAIGKRFVLTDLFILCGGVTDSVVTIFDETNSSGNILFRGTIDVSNNKQYSQTITLKTPYLGSSIGNSLKITTSANITVDVVMHGYEV